MQDHDYSINAFLLLQKKKKTLSEIDTEGFLQLDCNNVLISYAVFIVYTVFCK